MATRTSRTAWNGTIEQGAGEVELTSSGKGTFDVSWPRRTSEGADGVTSPEELLAAAHTSCFAMQFAAMIGEEGGTPQSLEIKADVAFGPDPAGGFHVQGITLDVSGEVEGIDAETFRRLAEGAKEQCPISKALTGVEITLGEVRFQG